MKTMCPPGYHHNDFVATHSLGHMMYAVRCTVHMMSTLCVVDHLLTTVSGCCTAPLSRPLRLLRWIALRHELLF